MASIQCAVDVARQYGIELKREGNCYRGDCPVCGRPHLTFAPSRYVGFYFACNCYGQDGHHTGSGANLDFWLRSLGARGQAQPVYIPTENEQKPAKALAAGVLAKVVHGAAARLTAGSEGAKYLESRGLNLATAKAWRLGYGFWCKYENKSIVIPWYGPDHTLIGISHRLISPTNNQPKAPWQPGMAGRTAGLLCGWHTHQARPVLVIVEGILNAPSIYQALGDLVDVLTPGSENTNPATWPVDRLRQWDRIVIWADEPDKANVWGKTLRTKLRITSRPNGGKKVDANDVLKRGELRTFIEEGL
ncbi:MAG: hypothetical protein U0350_05995 [Caldilineaceae bacterium]